MIWFWLCLLSGLILGLLVLGGLWVGRWWRRREARKHAEALARQTVAAMVAAAQPFGEALLSGFRQLAPVMNEAAKSIGRFEETFRAASTAPDPDPDSPEGTPNA
jgi:hypothetical protein